MTTKPKSFERARCGGGTGKGWWPIINAAETILDLAVPDWKVDQVKEKFGGLRFYTNFSDVEVKRWEDESDERYEERSKRIYEMLHNFSDIVEWAAWHACEECGAPPVDEQPEEGGGWRLTLCQDCWDTRIAARDKQNREWEERKREQS